MYQSYHGMSLVTFIFPVTIVMLVKQLSPWLLSDPGKCFKFVGTSNSVYISLFEGFYYHLLKHCHQGCMFLTHLHAFLRYCLPAVFCLDVLSMKLMQNTVFGTFKYWLRYMNGADFLLKILSAEQSADFEMHYSDMPQSQAIQSIFSCMW